MVCKTEIQLIIEKEVLVRWIRDFFFLVFIFISPLLFAQKDGRSWEWPEDRATAEEKVALYFDYMSIDDYREAANNLHWLLLNAPKLNLSIYQNGSKIYEKLAEETSESTQKQVFLDSMLLMYDIRMSYFGDSLNAMNRKAYKAYKYLIRDESKYPMLLDLFDETFRISGKEVLNSNLPAYMNVIKLNKLKYGNLSTEEVLTRYGQISDIIEYKISQGKDLDKQKNLIDRMLTEAIPEGIDCEFVITNMGPEFYSNKDDLKQAKKIFNFLLQGGCTEDPLFLESAKVIQSKEPSYGMCYKVIARQCLALKKYDCAEDYLNEAIALAGQPNQKADVFIDLGKLSTLQKNKVEARDYFRKAIEEDQFNKDAFNAIGRLYYYSASDCAGYDSKVKDRLPYIAAYTMFKKAGNTHMMKASKEQFPSKEEIFNENIEKGNTMAIKCWINETVVVQTRD